MGNAPRLLRVGFALALLAPLADAQETIDPNDDGSQYAYQENQGWFNAEPLGDGGPGVSVGATALTGYIWGENIGWISLSCANRGTCGSVPYGVTNAGGALAGWAWAENAGWISFSCANRGTCTSVSYGVTIDAAGIFRGNAWSENLGWITWSDSSPVVYQVQTSVSSSSTSGDHVVGQGLGQPNPNEVKIYTGGGSPSGVAFLAYGAGQWGVNVATGELDGVSLEEILTGPGPGAVFGPQVRAFLRSGSPMAKINFYAYGTLRYGVNVGGGDVDADGFAEILSGAGPGAVFGPHVRGFGYDGSALTPMSKINFFAYSTLKYGVNVASGSVDPDPYAEIVTAPGPGSVFGSQVRGWNYDATALDAIAKLNYVAFSYAGYGANVACGDVDGDGIGELAATPGPGSGHPSRFVGHDFDGVAVSALTGFDTTPFPSTHYGGRVGAGDVDPGGLGEELLAGAGRDPAADATVIALAYDGSAVAPLPGSFNPFPSQRYGVNVAGGALGF